MPHRGVLRTTAVLWARGVTPTSGVRPPVYQPRLLPRASGRLTVHGFGRRMPGARPSCEPPPVHSSADAPRRARSFAVGAVIAALVLAGGPASARPVPERVDAAASGDIEPAGRDWAWPLDPFRLERAYEAPAHRYGAGHRGIDLRPVAAGSVMAPAAGIVAFAGPVAGRGILTIDHGDGLVTTLEPIDSPLEAGEPVLQGAPVGVITLGGHTAPGALHFGVRLDGEYLNPLVLLGGVPRAVLLPCC